MTARPFLRDRAWLPFRDGMGTLCNHPLYLDVYCRVGPRMGATAPIVDIVAAMDVDDHGVDAMGYSCLDAISDLLEPT